MNKKYEELIKDYETKISIIKGLMDIKKESLDSAICQLNPLALQVTKAQITALNSAIDAMEAILLIHSSLGQSGFLTKPDSAVVKIEKILDRNINYYVDPKTLKNEIMSVLKW